MQLGCCYLGGTFVTQATGNESQSSVDALKAVYDAAVKNGFDFLECTAGFINGLTDEELVKIKEMTETYPIPVRAINSLVPAEYQVSGDESGFDALDKYIEKTFARAKYLGIKKVVFGSGKARTSPDDCSPEKASERMVRFLTFCGKEAKKNGLTFIIEPLNKLETNMIVSVSEGYDYVCKVNDENVRLLADVYHMYMEKEDLSVLGKVLPVLKHIHVSSTGTRKHPGIEKEEYLDGFIAELKKIGYEGDVSIEARLDDFDKDSLAGITYIKGELAK